MQTTINNGGKARIPLAPATFVPVTYQQRKANNNNMSSVTSSLFTTYKNNTFFGEKENTFRIDDKLTDIDIIRALSSCSLESKDRLLQLLTNYTESDSSTYAPCSAVYRPFDDDESWLSLLESVGFSNEETGRLHALELSFDKVNRLLYLIPSIQPSFSSSQSRVSNGPTLFRALTLRDSVLAAGDSRDSSPRAGCSPLDTHFRSVCPSTGGTNLPSPDSLVSSPASINENDPGLGFRDMVGFTDTSCASSRGSNGASPFFGEPRRGRSRSSTGSNSSLGGSLSSSSSELKNDSVGTALKMPLTLLKKLNITEQDKTNFMTMDPFTWDNDTEDMEPPPRLLRSVSACAFLGGGNDSHGKRNVSCREFRGKDESNANIKVARSCSYNVDDDYRHSSAEFLEAQRSCSVPAVPTYGGRSPPEIIGAPVHFTAESLQIPRYKNDSCSSSDYEKDFSAYQPARISRSFSVPGYHVPATPCKAEAVTLSQGDEAAFSTPGKEMALVSGNNPLNDWAVSTPTPACDIDRLKALLLTHMSDTCAFYFPPTSSTPRIKSVSGSAHSSSGKSHYMGTECSSSQRGLFVLDGASQASQASQKSAAVRKKHKEAKWRRLSIANQSNPNHLSSAQESLFGNTPSPQPMFQSKRLPSRSPYLRPGARSPSIVSECDEFDGLCSVGAMHDSYRVLSELNFRGIVIGGKYEKCFDGSMPVVSVDAMGKRISQANFYGNGCLELQIYFPNAKRCRVVHLNSWVYCRTSPDGFLVSREILTPNKRALCFFLPKHPEHYPIQPTPSSFVRYEMKTWDDSVSFSDSNSLSGMAFFGADVSMEDATCRLSNPSSACKSSPGDRGADVCAADNMHELLCTSVDTDVDEDDDGGLEPDQFCSNFTQLDGYASNSIDSDESLLLADEADWNNSNMLNFVFAFLDRNGFDCQSVSKSWAMAAFTRKVRSMCPVLSASAWTAFVKRYEGEYINEGSSKRVFRLTTKRNRRQRSTSLPQQQQALSVMDINDLTDRGMGSTVERELEISMMTSALVSLNICPNFLQVYSVFQSDNQSPREWQKSAVSFTKKGEFQYIRMEYCVGGDAEEFVKAAGPDGVDVHTTRAMLFQMFFAVYSAREQLSLRHYDIKLLNFFCTDYTSLINSTACSAVASDEVNDFSNGITLTYAFGKHSFVVPLCDKGAVLLKLADFGTCSIGSQSLGRPINMYQFTTLENVPPEYLFLGLNARESYSADAFCLGLSFFHLLTGEAPYEELLKDVQCPPTLINHLHKIWLRCDASPANPYSIIAEVMNSLNNPKDTVLFDTLYRYIVLFGLPTQSYHESCVYGENNEVWMAVTKCLGFNERGEERIIGTGLGCNLPVRRGAKRVTDEFASCIEQFKRDRSVWSWKTGSSDILIRAREKLFDLGHSEDGVASAQLFDSLVCLDPSKRCTMHEALHNEIFYSLREENVLEDNCLSSSVQFLHYAKDKVHDSLPVL